MSRPSLRPLVLLAEDSDDDAFFFRWSLKKCGIVCDFVHARDGAEMIAYLRNCVSAEGPSGERTPDLVFLDLKMPGFTGFEVLAWIQQHPSCPPLNVAVLSGSDHAIDVQRAYELGATEYFVKPLSLDKLRARFDRWNDTVAPGRGNEGALPQAVAVAVPTP